MSNPYAAHNERTKANFDSVYDLPDPRGYFGTLGTLEYRAPEHGRRVFPALLGAIAGGRPRVLDLCCSYGVNAALLKHDLTLDDLYARYGSPDLAGLSRAELLADDAEFYKARRQASAPEVAGTDSAANAVRYALEAGLLDDGSAEDLERDDPTGGLARAARGARLLTVTGGVGYIWTRTFQQVLAAVVAAPGGEPPWVAAFAVRFVDYRPVARVLAGYGLATERVSLRTFQQRRFQGAAEQDHVLSQLAAAGMDPAGREEEGWYHAYLYVSRPSADASGVSADELLAASGALDY